MTTITTSRIYGLSGSADTGWTVDFGNDNYAYELTDETDDRSLSGTVTITNPNFTAPCTYVGAWGDGVVLWIPRDGIHYLLTNDGPFAPGFTFQSSALPYVTCFAAGTQIATPSGPVLVEALQAGDLVLTKDNGPQHVRWVGSRKLGRDMLSVFPHLHPIRIRAGALGDTCPERDLVVSPQHRVLVRSAVAQKMFGANEVLVAAKQLLEIEGIDIATDLEEVEYFHFLCDRHEVVISNGAQTESLYMGREALRSVGPAARAEILALFPELEDEAFFSQAARPMLRGRQGRKLASRHAQNEKALVA